MTTTMTMPVLALDDFGLIVFVAIMLISAAGSAIGKVLKKAEEKQKQKGQTEAADEPRPDLDELAAKRRAELMAEAQRRRAQQSAAGGAAPPTQPLTMAERMQRARQQAAQRVGAVQERVQKLKQAQADEHRRAAEAELERRRQAALRQQQQRQRAQRSRQQPQRPAAAPRPAEPAPRRTPPPQPHYAREHDEVHRLVVTRPAKPVDAKPALPRGGFSLRQAMIWKEILDKPVGLRDGGFDFPS